MRREGKCGDLKGMVMEIFGATEGEWDGDVTFDKNWSSRTAPYSMLAIDDLSLIKQVQAVVNIHKHQPLNCWSCNHNNTSFKLIHE